MAIIGRGNIASVLTDHPDRIYFASGVSDSSEIRERVFNREIWLLSKQDSTKHLVYFSSLAVFYSHTPYANHKRDMELRVKKYFPRYTIIRLGNCLWDKNPLTLINYLKKHPEAVIQDTYRYLCSKEEFLHWIGLIPPWPCEMNIPGERVKVKEIVKRIKAGKL